MIVLALAGPALAEPSERIPVEHVYATHGGVELKAYVFEPDASVARPCPAVVVVHGGGWAMGEASWGFGSAKRYASIGLVGISVQYRLSDQRSITPLDAMEDIRAAIRWARSNAADLRVDPERIAGFGWSAGAHLLAASAIFPGDGTVSAAPDALLLKSPAVALESDGWMKRILLGRAEARQISPADHVRSGLPPLIIVQGKTDTVTPTDGVQRFCEAMLAAGNRCDLHVFDGVGHLFTPSSEPDDGWPNPDGEVVEDADQKIDAFLESVGFLTSND